MDIMLVILNIIIDWIGEGHGDIKNKIDKWS